MKFLIFSKTGYEENIKSKDFTNELSNYCRSSGAKYFVVSSSRESLDSTVLSDKINGTGTAVVVNKEMLTNGEGDVVNYFIEYLMKSRSLTDATCKIVRISSNPEVKKEKSYTCIGFVDLFSDMENKGLFSARQYDLKERLKFYE